MFVVPVAKPTSVTVHRAARTTTPGKARSPGDVEGRAGALPFSSTPWRFSEVPIHAGSATRPGLSARSRDVRAVARSTQAISCPTNDVPEHEADRVEPRLQDLDPESNPLGEPLSSAPRSDRPARHALAGASPTDAVSRSANNQGATEHVRQPNGSSPSTPFGLVEEVMSAPGERLANNVRARMEDVLGTTLNDIRVHVGLDGQRAANSLGAQAFTIGSHMVFARGAYDPQRPVGLALLAHELTHVLQHRRHALPSSSRLLSDPADPAELEADAIAHGVWRGECATRLRFAQPRALISRAPEDWFRGFAEGAETPGAAEGRGPVHDLGNGTYFTDRLSVAEEYAKTRVSIVGGRAVPRVIHGTIDPERFGKVLDLTQDSDFMRTFNQVKSVLPKVSGEPYRNLVDGHLKAKGLSLDDFEVVIGPEGVRGGRQMRVRSPQTASQVTAAMTPVKPGLGSPPGGSGGSSPPPGGEPGGAPPATPSGAQAKPSGATGRAPVPGNQPQLTGRPPTSPLTRSATAILQELNSEQKFLQRAAAVARVLKIVTAVGTIALEVLAIIDFYASAQKASLGEDVVYEQQHAKAQRLAADSSATKTDCKDYRQSVLAIQLAFIPYIMSRDPDELRARAFASLSMLSELDSLIDLLDDRIKNISNLLQRTETRLIWLTATLESGILGDGAVAATVFQACAELMLINGDLRAARDDLSEARRTAATINRQFFIDYIRKCLARASELE
jgi:Domain of unknown function (DUF4157)